MTKEVPIQSIIPPENIVKDGLINRIRYLKRTIRNFTMDFHPRDILKVAVDIEEIITSLEEMKFLLDEVSSLRFLQRGVLDFHIVKTTDSGGVSLSFGMLQSACNLTLPELPP